MRRPNTRVSRGTTAKTKLGGCWMVKGRCEGKFYELVFNFCNRIDFRLKILYVIIIMGHDALIIIILFTLRKMKGSLGLCRGSLL